MHHLARHCVACFLTRGDLVCDLAWEMLGHGILVYLDVVILYFHFSPSTFSLFIGRKDVMCSRGFWLIRIGPLTMPIGCGYRVHHFFIRFHSYLRNCLDVRILVFYFFFSFLLLSGTSSINKIVSHKSMTCIRYHHYEVTWNILV